MRGAGIGQSQVHAGHLGVSIYIHPLYPMTAGKPGSAGPHVWPVPLHEVKRFANLLRHFRDRQGQEVQEALAAEVKAAAKQAPRMRVRRPDPPVEAPAKPRMRIRGRVPNA